MHVFFHILTSRDNRDAAQLDEWGQIFGDPDLIERTLQESDDEAEAEAGLGDEEERLRRVLRLKDVIEITFP